MSPVVASGSGIAGLAQLSAQQVALVVLFGTLSVGSAVRLAVAALRPSESTAQRLASLRTWWLLALGLGLAVVLGLLGVCLLMAVASAVGFAEYRRLVVRRGAAKAASAVLFATVPVAYAAVYLGFGHVVLPSLPLVCLLLVAAPQIVAGDTADYLRNTAALVFGAVLLIFALAHAALLAAHSGTDAAPLGGVGWFLYLVLLTEANDIAQALVGRRLGRRKITPKVSPNKSLEGLLGGTAATVAAALLLAPLLTTLRDRPVPFPVALPGAVEPWVWPLAAGLLINLTGFLGDLNLSAIKRNLGVKDSSSLLPGMGGALDRLDSLTLTAPCFYYLIALPALWST